MEKRIIKKEGKSIAVLQSKEILIAQPQDALDLVMTVSYEDKCDRIVLNKEALAEDFFDLTTGFAGEVLQKMVQYGEKLAIVGDFSSYSSKALRDLIRESNRGKDVFFVPTEQEAIERLTQVR